MSEKLIEAMNARDGGDGAAAMDVTAAHGGKTRGPYIQFTLLSLQEFIQLDRKAIHILHDKLGQWLDEQLPRNGTVDENTLTHHYGFGDGDDVWCKGALDITSHADVSRGPCLQVTLDGHTVERLDFDQVDQMTKALYEWVRSHSQTQRAPFVSVMVDALEEQLANARAEVAALRGEVVELKTKNETFATNHLKMLSEDNSEERIDKLTKLSHTRLHEMLVLREYYEAQRASSRLRTGKTFASADPAAEERLARAERAALLLGYPCSDCPYDHACELDVGGCMRKRSR